VSGKVIAIDGPAGAGKSTIARRLANRLGFTYIDTGAMYRSVALIAARRGVNTGDDAGLSALAADLKIDLAPPNRVVVDGEDVTEAIRATEVTAAASVVAAVPGVRRAMVEKQRAVARTADVVMEGRDIGTVVFPDAAVKIFLDAHTDERVRRRHGERPDVAQERLAVQIAERDQRDRSRVDSPLIPAEDAHYVDSTGLTLEQVEEQIWRKVNQA
jgi:cytidylate kinase